MTKFVCFLFFSLWFNWHSISQENLVSWEEVDSVFSWDYFQKGYVKGGFSAVSVFEKEFKFQEQNDSIEIICFVRLNREKSIYSKSEYGKNTPPLSLLNHEKYHFAIHEYFVRLFYYRISKLKVKPNVLKKIKRLNSKLDRKCAKYNSKYDSQTNYSLDNEKQRTWNQELDLKLKGLIEFNMERIILVKP